MQMLHETQIAQVKGELGSCWVGVYLFSTAVAKVWSTRVSQVFDNDIVII